MASTDPWLWMQEWMARWVVRTETHHLRRLIPPTYQCGLCGGAFESDWTDEAAEKEAAENFTPEELEDRAVVCDDCFKKMGLG